MYDINVTFCLGSPSRRSYSKFILAAYAHSNKLVAAYMRRLKVTFILSIKLSFSGELTAHVPWLNFCRA